MSAMFETDGIRKPFGEYPITDEGAYHVGQAVGVYFAESGDQIVVGYDTRESSPRLADALTDGITATGVDVDNLNVIPTPGLAYLTETSADAVAGVMITASHNLYGDNGIKIYRGDGSKLDDSTQFDLEDLIVEAAKGKNLRPGRTGDTTDSRRNWLYEKFLIDSAGDADFDGLAIGIDMANGATSSYADQVFRDLGANVTSLFDRPNGTNINLDCGATAMANLVKVVNEQGLDIGIALDGDGDRLMMVDSQGRVLDGDHLMYMNAVAGHEPGVVATVMSNMGLANALSEKGIDLKRTGVGDRYVLEGLREYGLNLGGEQSGHMIFYKTLTTGDGILAAIQSVRATRQSDRPLAEWRDDVTLLPQKLINVDVFDKDAVMTDPRVAEMIGEFNARQGSSGRVLIRPSGTEQKVRVMVESTGDAQAQAAGLAEQVAAIAKSLY